MKLEKIDLYEPVKQADKCYWTIFMGMSQLCDDDGNPVQYSTYEKAEKACEELNKEFAEMRAKVRNYTKKGV